jgi:hypothetical protein
MSVETLVLVVKTFYQSNERGTETICDDFVSYSDRTLLRMWKWKIRKYWFNCWSQKPWLYRLRGVLLKLIGENWEVVIVNFLDRTSACQQAIEESEAELRFLTHRPRPKYPSLQLFFNNWNSNYKNTTYLLTFKHIIMLTNKVKKIKLVFLLI